MKRNIILSLGVVIALAFSACGTTESHSHDAAEEITLNDGQRWAVNDEMKPHIQIAEDMVKVYIEDGDADYQGLADRLGNQNKQLISSCTMEGESHEQLHHWLHPHLELVNELKDASEEDANSIIAQLKASFEMYHQYFE